MISQYEILKNILENPKLNYIRCNYAGHAKDQVSAFFRTETGETVNHIKKSKFFSDRMTSSRSTSLLLTMARETGSRNENDEYDFRSLMISSLAPDTLKKVINIPEISACENFQGYEPIDLAPYPVFPCPLDDNLFASNLVNLRSLEILKEKMKNKLNNLKKQLDKDGILEQSFFEMNGETKTNFKGTIYFKKPEGTTETLLDSNNTEIKKTPIPTLGFQLHPIVMPNIEFNAKQYSLNNIVQLWNEIEKISKKVAENMKNLRPYELGVMERLTDPKSSFYIGDIEFQVKELKNMNYSWTSEDMNKMENGEYKMGTVSKTQGRWICDIKEIPCDLPFRENPLKSNQTVEV